MSSRQSSVGEDGGRLERSTTARLSVDGEVAYRGADAAPEIHKELVGLAHGSGGAVKLEDDALRRTLHDICDWVQERVEKSRMLVRSEMDALIVDARRTLATQQDKSFQMLRDQVRKETDDTLKSLKEKMREVDEKAGRASEQAEDVRTQQLTLREQVQARADIENELQMKMLQEELKAIHGRLGQLAQAPAPVVAQPSSPSGAGGDAGGSAVVSLDELNAVSRLNKELQDATALLQRRVQFLEVQQEQLRVDTTGKLAGEVGRLQATLEAQDDSIAEFKGATNDELIQLAEKMRGLQEGKADQTSVGAQISDIREANRLDAQIRDQRMEAEAARRAREMEERVRALDQALRATAHEHAIEYEAAQESLRQLVLELENQSARTAELGQSLEAMLNTRGDLLSTKLEELKGQFVDMAGVLEDLQEEVKQTDKERKAQANGLQDSISMVAATIKDKRQSVLFGARCLSCNRVFDDVEKGPGAVDLRREKEQAQALAEITRALHNPLTKPMDDVRMIAVKVGRPTSLASSGASGTYAGRDALNPAFSAEDASLVPASAARWLTTGASPSPPQTASGGVRQRVLLPADTLPSTPPLPRSPPGIAEVPQAEQAAALQLPDKRKGLPKLSLTQLLDRNVHVSRSAR